MELLKERGEFLSEYWFVGYYHDNKELNYKIFKTKTAHLLNDLDEPLFKEVFGHTFVELVEKLINTVGKEEENQIIVDVLKIVVTKLLSKCIINLLLGQHINVVI